MKYLFAFFLLVLMSSSCEAQNLQVSTNLLSWYEVYPHTSSSQTFTIKNPTNATITGNFVGVSDTFTISGGKSFSIATGETQIDTVTFSPQDIGGGYDIDSMVLESSDGPPYAYVILHGHARNLNVGTIRLSPSVLQFPTLMVGEADTMATYAYNVGTSPLKVSYLRIALTGQGSFRVAKSFNKTIAEGDSLPISVIFQPSHPGSFHDTLFIQTIDTTHPIILVPLLGTATPNLGVEEILQAVAGIYPSVATTSLNVQTGEQEPAEIIVADVLGRECLRARSVLGEVTLDIRDLPAGGYFCLVKSPSATTVMRFVVSK